MSEPQLSVVSVIFSIHNNMMGVFLENRKNIFYLPTTSIVATDLQLEMAAQRTLQSLSGLSIPYWEQVQTICHSTHAPPSWSVSVIYYGLLPGQNPDKETKQLTWMSIESLALHSLPDNSFAIVELCLKRLQNKSLYTSLPIFLLPMEFTLTELQKTYEIILGFKIEKKSFRRRLLDSDLLEETSNVRRASHRPAQLYRLATAEPYFFARIIEGAREREMV